MCRDCLCFQNGECFYGGTDEFCPCQYAEPAVYDPADDDTQTMRGNGVSWSDFI